MAENKKSSGRFIIPILIGGALGSMVAVIFGRRKKIELEDQSGNKEGWFRRWFRKRKS